MAAPASDVPDVLAPNLRCVFCGINPGRVSAAAHAHFANPRNDFWRLLHDAGFTPRLYAPDEQFGLLELGYGVTNAAYRTTPGSGDLRRGDFDASRLERLAEELRPRAIAFVGKEAYRGAFGERPELGPQLRTIGSTALFVLPSTSPANAAVPYAERLRWFAELHTWLEPVRARRCARSSSTRRSASSCFGSRTRSRTRSGGRRRAEASRGTRATRSLSVASSSRSAGSALVDPGPVVWVREHVFPWNRQLLRQAERFHLVRIDRHDVAPTIDLVAEGVYGHRWWTLDELEATGERLAPRALRTELRRLLRDGAPAEPLDVSV